MLVLGCADFGNIVAEFAGLASGMGIFGITKYMVVPAGAILVWALIVRGRYKPVEKILIFASLVYFAYPISAFLSKPNWDIALKQTFIPTLSGDPAYLAVIVGLIGTTITPWMQFYLQASVVERGVDARHYSLCRLDVILGCIFTDVIAFFIVVACAATIYHPNRPEFTDVAQAAIALRPFAGKFAAILFAIGLINASLLSAAILPLATSYNICEGLGFESGIDKRFSEAPIFYWLYTLLIGGGALCVLIIPNAFLLKFILYSQMANGVLLPFVLVFMLRLVNRPRLMGAFKNKGWQNMIAWATAITVVVLAGAWLYNGLIG
jgi:Mn2+/Fe2+ NRAMP family transporter